MYCNLPPELLCELVEFFDVLDPDGCEVLEVILEEVDSERFARYIYRTKFSAVPIPQDKDVTVVLKSALATLKKCVEFDECYDHGYEIPLRRFDLNWMGGKYEQRITEWFRSEVTRQNLEMALAIRHILHRREDAVDTIDSFAIKFKWFAYMDHPEVKSNINQGAVLRALGPHILVWHWATPFIGLFGNLTYSAKNSFERALVAAQYEDDIWSAAKTLMGFYVRPEFYHLICYSKDSDVQYMLSILDDLELLHGFDHPVFLVRKKLALEIYLYDWKCEMKLTHTFLKTTLAACILKICERFVTRQGILWDMTTENENDQEKFCRENASAIREVFYQVINQRRAAASRLEWRRVLALMIDSVVERFEKYMVDFVVDGHA